MPLLYRPEREGGAFGDGGVSMPGISGRVHNLSLAAGSLGSFVVSFLWEPASGDTTGLGYRFYLVIDGDVTGLVWPGVVYTTEPFPDGPHDIRVVPIPASQGVPLGLSVDLLGDRAIVTWTAGTEGDLAAYELFWDAGTGTVDTVNRKALINTIDVPTDYSDIVPTITVGGTGRIRVSGKYSGPPRNGFVVVEIDDATAASGEFLGADQKQWIARFEGVQVATGRLYSGLQVTPLDGLRISFLDDASTYMAGNTYYFFLGPRTYWVSEALDPGTYKFQVRGVDADGDTGTLSDETSLTLVATPSPMEDVVATWDASTRVVTVTWSDPGESSDVYIYTNYDFAYGVMRDYVLEEGPAVIALALDEEADTATIAEASVGDTLRLYVRAVKDGEEEDNAQLITVELTAAGVAVGLSDVIIESAEAATGPKIAATIAIDLAGTIPSAIRLLTNTSDTTAGATAHTVSLPSFALNTGSVLRGVVYTGTLADETYYLWAQAQDSEGDWADAGASTGPITILDGAPAKITGVQGASY